MGVGDGEGVIVMGMIVARGDSDAAVVAGMR